MPSAIEASLTDRSKVLVIVSPNNPTGAVIPPETIREIAALARQRNLLVISDEIYASLVYDDAKHLSIATVPGMRERTITLNGFSKSYAMTGWRVGYLAAPWLHSIDIEPRHTLSINTATPSQYAALAALEGPGHRRVDARHLCRAPRHAHARPQGTGVQLWQPWRCVLRIHQCLDLESERPRLLPRSPSPGARTAASGVDVRRLRRPGTCA